MSQGNKDKFLPVFFGALGAVVAGFGYLGCSASSAADDAKAAYEKKLQDLDRLEKEDLSRTDENAKKKKELVDAYVLQVEELSKTLLAHQAEETPIANAAFQGELKRVTDEVLAAAKARGVKLPEQFDLGMGRYLSDFPVEGAAPKLRAQLAAIAFVANAAFDSGVTEINALVRPELEFEKPKKEEPAAADTNKPKPKTTAKPPAKGPQAKATASVLDESKVLERQPLQMTVTGKNKALLTLVERLANTSPEKQAPHFFTIRTLRVENFNKDGIDRNREVAIKEEPNPEDKDKPVKYDAEYMLGFEDIKMELNLDIVRFLPAPESDEKAKPAKSSTAAN
jgi:hypothetical protein